MRAINPSETEIACTWQVVEGRVIGDEQCVRIERLINEHLVKTATDWSGWDTLYRDPDDGRLWELTYPQSELHGGGPPLLRCLTVLKAKGKYAGVV